MSDEIKKHEKKADDPLVYIPDGARINFDPTGQNPPRTKYNAWTLIMDDKTYRDVIGGFYGPDKDKRNP